MCAQDLGTPEISKLASLALPKGMAPFPFCIVCGTDPGAVLTSVCTGGKGCVFLSVCLSSSDLGVHPLDCAITRFDFPQNLEQGLWCGHSEELQLHHKCGLKPRLPFLQGLEQWWCRGEEAELTSGFSFSFPRGGCLQKEREAVMVPEVLRGGRSPVC